MFIINSHCNFLIATAAATVVGLPLAAGANMVENPTFDGNLDGWSTFNNAFYSDDYSLVEDTGSLELYGPGGSSTDASGADWYFTPTPGVTYTASTHIYTPSSDSILGTNNDTRLRIEFFDENGDRLDRAELSLFDGRDGGFPEDEWVFFETSGVAPEGAIDARLRLIFFGRQNDPGSVYWDQVALVPEPATLGLLSLGSLLMLRRRRSG